MKTGLLGVEVSSRKLRYVFVERKKGKVLLSRKGTASIEGAAPSSISEGLRDILAREAIRPSKVFFTVMREDVITQQIVIPAMPEAEMEEVICGEIEKIHSFSNLDYAYIYSHYKEDKNKSRVIFSCVPKKLIDGLFESARQQRIAVGGLELAPLSLLAVAYSFGGTKERALVVLDETVSYVCLFGGSQCRLFYTTNTGKADLFREGNVLDPAEFKSWIDELRRIFKSFFLTQRQGFEDILFAWDSEGAERLDEEVAGALSMPVRRFDLSGIPGVEASKEERLNPAYAICAAPVISSIKRYASEFRPEGLFLEKQLAQTVRRSLVTAAAYLFVAGILLWGVAERFAALRDDAGRKRDETVEAVALLTEKTELLTKERARAEQAREILMLQAQAVRNLNRVTWSRVFGEISSVIPLDVSFTSFKVSGTDKVDVRGNALKIESVSDLMRSIDRSGVLIGAKFNYLREVQVEETKIFDFSILADVRKDGNEADENKAQ